MANITTGVVGQRWRASVTPWGRLEPWDGSPPLDWYVAADDRWHVPRLEPAVRQSRVDGTPVTETRIRVPGGDVVQTVYTCADAGGRIIVTVGDSAEHGLASLGDHPLRQGPPALALRQHEPAGALRQRPPCPRDLGRRW